MRSSIDRSRPDEPSRHARIRRHRHGLRHESNRCQPAREQLHGVAQLGRHPQAMLTNVRPTIGGEPNPMSNVHARLAMAHALDRDALAASVGPGVQVPTSPFSPDNPWGQPSDQNRYPDYNPDAAEGRGGGLPRRHGRERTRGDHPRNERHRCPHFTPTRAAAALGRRYQEQGRRARCDCAHQRGGRRALPGRDVRELQLARSGSEPLLLVRVDGNRRGRRQHQLHRLHERHDRASVEAGSRERGLSTSDTRPTTRSSRSRTSTP